MSKHNYFTKFFKNINLLINSLLKNNLNKLNIDNFFKIARSNKFFLIFVALVISFLSYLLIPNIYHKAEISKELKSQLLNKYNLDFNLSQKQQYNFFPRPHFTYENSSILKDEYEISKIKKIKIYVSLNNLFSLKNIEVKDLILQDANFNLNSENYNFFINLLNQNFKDNSFVIKDSNIFYRNIDDEVLFINKIISMKYFYDVKKLRNTFVSKNEIFNLPFSLELRNDKIKKKIFSKLDLKLLKLQVEDELDYTNDIKTGSTNITFNKQKIKTDYKIDKKYFIFNIFSKLDSQDFTYKGNINFNPFYSNLEGKAKKFSLSSLFNSNGIISQLIKTDLFNNKNLDFKLSIFGKEINKYENFKNLFLNSKIQEGLISFDDTKFSWKNNTNFRIFDSLMFVKDNELILDSKAEIIIKNSGEIYKSLLTPKNYRTEIKKIVLNFNYNFDQKILSFNDIIIDNKINNKLSKIYKSLIFRDDKLQNKIYFKNKLNEAIKAYAG